jgi:hypothetical protein
MPFVLSFHASYRCQDRGVCCSSGWPIPIEAPQLRAAEAALAAGRLSTPRRTPRPFIRIDPASAEAPSTVGVVDGACVFHRSGSEAGCEIHRVLGHPALPLACRQFPRVSVQDPRGSSVTLSHYCPTAAALLEPDAPVTIVDDGAGFPRAGEYVGLDARASLPPRLRPDMLMDWTAWWEWERLAVAALAQAPDIEAGLGRLRAAVEFVRPWRPGDGPLVERVRQAFNSPAADTRGLEDARATRIAEVFEAIPPGVRPAARPSTAAGAASSPGVTQRYAIAHAFANWTAHLGTGLRAWLRSIEAAHALVTSGMGPGEADLWLRHLADSAALADAWSAAEATGPADAIAIR